MQFENKQKAIIAVIGKSAAGKSAFIKSFSSNPELIDSEGRGQTTRTYLEYKFNITKEKKMPSVSAMLMSKEEFIDRRTEQIVDNLQKLKYEVKKEGITALSKKFRESDIYKQEVEQIILNSKDFFDINEFEFIDIDLNWIHNNYDMVRDVIENYQEMEDGKFSNKYFIKLKEILDNNKFENNGKDEYIISELLSIFFGNIYDYILEKIKGDYLINSFLLDDGNHYHIKFEIADETKELLAVLLRVKYEGSRKKSLTGLLNGLKIESNICANYYDEIKKQGFNEIELIDTFGLDHSNPEDEEALIERYNRIFGKDYPNINIVFFVEAFHTGASTEFSQAINLLYSQRPDIMTYVVGTYIDENNITINDKMWLCSREKKSDGIPVFNGSVIDILYGLTIITTLMRNDVSESMATMRCEIMRKRFAPFCGKLEKVENPELREIFNTMNNISINSLFYSISREEHLGDRFIDINIILNKIEDLDWEDILKIFVQNVTENFTEIIRRTQIRSRTRGKIRKNLKNHILGFDGSTIDATWYRVFRDAYIQTFSKQIKLQVDPKYTISKALGYEGNSMIAVDELINKFMHRIYSRACSKEIVGWYNHELNCNRCFRKEQIDDHCIWCLFINLAGKENFDNDSTPVGSWLIKLHNFSEKANADFYNKLRELFIVKFRQDFVYTCRIHNAKLIVRALEENMEVRQINQEICKYIYQYDKSCPIDTMNKLVSEMI